jgi:hypothetical protein
MFFKRTSSNDGDTTPPPDTRADKTTQQLTPSLPQWAQNKTTNTLWNWLSNPWQLPHATQLGLAAAGGAFAVVLVSLSLGWVLSRGEPLRNFFGNANPDNFVIQPQKPKARAQIVVTSQTPVPAQSHETQFIKAALQPVHVDGLNQEGTGLADLKPLTDEDRQRFQMRGEEARGLRERRLLEDKKRAIERQLEDKQLEEKRRQDDAQFETQRREEDKKRLEGWIEEDRRMLDERLEKEKREREEEQKKLAEAIP